MENRLDEGLAAIKAARNYVKEGNYAFARDKYVEGLGLLHKAYSEERYCPMTTKESSKARHSQGQHEPVPGRGRTEQA